MDRNNARTPLARVEALAGQVLPRPADSQASTISKMGKLEETLAKGVEDGKIPHAIVCATNKNGILHAIHLPTSQPRS